MSDKKIFIQLTVDDKGSVVMKEFGKNAEQSLGGVAQKSGSFASTIKGHWMGITAAAAGVFAAIASLGKAFDLADLGAKALQAEDAFERMAESAGINAREMAAEMKAASLGIMDDSDLMQKAAKGLAQGMNKGEIIALVKDVRFAARLAGQDVKTAYETITDALANQMPRALKQYGLVSKEELKTLEKALQAGVEDIRLTDLALANLAIQTARFGNEAKSANERIQEMKATWNNLKEEAGKGLLTVLSEIVYLMKQIQVLSGDSTVIKFINLLAQLRSPGEFASRVQTEGWGKALSPRATEQENPKPESLEIGGADLQLLKAQRDKFAIIQEMEGKIAQKEAQKKLAEIAKLNQSIEDATAKLTLSEMDQAERQAQIWRAQGADRVKVSAWTAAQIEVIRQKESDQWAEHARLIMQENEREYQQRKQIQDQIDAVKLTGLERVYKEAELLREQDYLDEELIQEWIAAKIIETRRDAFETVKEYAQGYRLFQEEQLDELATKFREAGIAEIDIERWKTNELKKYALQRAQFTLENTESESEAVMARFEIMSLQMRSGAQIWADGMAEAFDGGFRTINEVFFDALEGRMKSFSDYMQAFGTIVRRVLADIATELLKASTLKAMGFGGSGSGGGSDWLSAALSFGTSMFGGGGSTSGWGGDLGGMDTGWGAGGDYRFAEGGRPPVGRASLVGEKGPELFIPDRPGTIVPNSALSGSGGVLNLTSQIHIGVPGLSKKQLSELHGEMEEGQVRVVERWFARNM